MRAKDFTPLFEINFNDPKLKSVLDLPISCGFEAETIWPSINPSSEDISSLDDVDLSFRDTQRVDTAYHEWILNEYTDEINDVIDNYVSFWVKQNYNDYYDEFIEDRSLEDELEEWLSDNPDAEKADFIKQEHSFDYTIFVSENVDRDKFLDDAVEDVKINHPMEDWINLEFYSIYDMLADYTSWEPSPAGSVEDVAEELRIWTDKEVLSGSYHSYSGVDQDFWRVEEDQSINENEGKGAEIISPVYKTPRQMLTDMNSLFKYFEKNNVVTDKSTGLHVTMSWNGNKSVEPNKLKMAVLLGDQYLLKQFNREFNHYTQSQMKLVQDQVSLIKKDFSDFKSIKELENLLEKSVSDDKKMSIHFKSDTNKNNNNLVEFRIGGGKDYHLQMEKIIKAVVRYSVAMEAGYDETAYQKDYIKALIRLFTPKTTVSEPSDEIYKNLQQLSKDRLSLVTQLSNMVSPKYKVPVMKYFTNAYKQLDDAINLIQGSKQQAMIAEDADQPPEWQGIMTYAQHLFINALGLLVIDIATKKLGRLPSSVVVRLRREVSNFRLTYEEIWKSLVKETWVLDQLGNNYSTKEKIQKALNTIFKQTTVPEQKPAFTVNYDPSTQLIFLPRELAQNATSESPTVKLKPSDFIIVPLIEYKKVYNVIRNASSVRSSLSTYKNALSIQSQSLSSESENINELNELIKMYTQTLEEIEKEVSMFLQKYKFLPPSMFSNYMADDTGIDAVQLTDRDINKLSLNYNIVFA